MQTENPTRKAKLLFWLALGVLSTFFAEVISGSIPFPFVPVMGLWGLLVVLPLYTLHTLVFAYFVYRFGKPVFHTLFFAGALSGTYEAYATGVLWAGWSTPLPIAVFELGIIETLLLVFFWHPVLVFIIPVVFVETYLTRSNESLRGVANFTTLKALIIPAVVFAFFQSLNMGSATMALMVSLTSIPVVALIILIWLKLGLNRYRMRELLPNKAGFRIIFALMLLQYLFLGAVSIGKYPGVAGHLAVLALYLVLTLGFVKSLRASRQTEIQHIGKPAFTWRGGEGRDFVDGIHSGRYGIFVRGHIPETWYLDAGAFDLLGFGNCIDWRCSQAGYQENLSKPFSVTTASKRWSVDSTGTSPNCAE